MFTDASRAIKVDASGNDGLSKPIAAKPSETVPWAWMASSNTIEEGYDKLVGRSLELGSGDVAQDSVRGQFL